MDRFIGQKKLTTLLTVWYLKSSMDRFIVKTVASSLNCQCNLKSSMDRFIDLMFQNSAFGNKI